MDRVRFLRRAALVVVALAAVVGTSCSSSSASGRGSAAGAGDGRLVVATTVAPITDIVRQVVGDRVELVGLIPGGVDSHTFEPSPQTARTLGRANVLFMNGLHLEGTTLEQAEANMPGPVAMPRTPGESLDERATGSQIVKLGDMTLPPDEYAYDFSFPKDKGDPNPHVWMDPMHAKRWSEIVLQVMERRDPAGAAYYRANQTRFAQVLDQLDGATAASINSIPPDHRKLLTYHDSFAYFSRRYGIAVLGAVQPSDFSEPSAKEIESLIAQVKTSRVPAIFGSEVFPSTVLEQVAAESGARYIDKLSDDELPGDPSAPEHTYIGMMVYDVRTLTEALGGNPAPLAAVPVTKTWQPFR